MDRMDRINRIYAGFTGLKPETPFLLILKNPVNPVY
jgi:hypothetical protein